ncbi:PAS domain S-box protein [bacterium]|nr:PAS domain S-box protein [bacterium]
MNKPSDRNNDPSKDDLRKKVLGLGERSMHKSYYPALQARVRDLERFRRLLDYTDDGIFMLEMPAGRIIDANAAASELTRHSMKQLLTKHFADFLPADDWEQHFLGAFESSSHPKKSMFITRIEPLGSSELFVEVSVNFEKLDDTLYSIVVVRDVTEALQTRENLRQLDEIIRQSPLIVFITDAHGNIQYVNPEFSKVTQYKPSEVLGKNPRLLQSGKTSPETYRDLWTTILDGRVWRGELCNRKKNGEEYWESGIIFPFRGHEGEISNFVGIKQDITDSRRMNEHLQHQQKMDAVGRLAGGIAHDFNNLLTVIHGNLDLLMARVDDRFSDFEGDLMKGILKATEQAATMTQQLLAFSRKQVMRTRHVSVNEVLLDMKNMIRRLVPESIELDTQLSQQELFSLADPGQLNQVVLNLVINAVHAMPEGGKLTLSTYLYAPRTGNICPTCKLPFDNEYAVIRVRDTGSGIKPEIQDKIFDAFFTTKDHGEGTGLGLSMVYGIVRQFSGHVKFSSELGRGSDFEILLPLVDPDFGRDVDDLKDVRGGREHILVVEDEGSVRDIVLRILKRNGYTVEAVESAIIASERLSAMDELPDLIISDIVMPGQSGLNFLAQLRKTHPTVLTLLISGYSPDVDMIQESGAAFLAKPFKTRELLEKVRDVLDGVANPRQG